GINPTPRSGQLSDSAPPPKAPVVAEQQQNVTGDITFPILLPAGLPVDVSEYQRKYEIAGPQVYPQLEAPLTPIALPLGLPVDVSEWQGKSQVFDWQQPNTTLRIVPPPVPPLPLSAVSLWTSAPPPPYQVIVEQRYNDAV